MALTDNISAYWKMDESSGNPVDATGNGNTLTNNGTVAFNAGIINNGADFGSANLTESFTRATNLGIDGGAMTFNVWINVTTAPVLNANSVIIEVVSNTSDVWYQLSYGDVSATKELRFNRLQAGVADGFLDVAQTFNTGTWYMVTATYDGTNSRTYVNASLVAGPTSFTGSGSDVTPDGTTLGFSVQGGTRHYSGHLDEVGVWTRALSGTEITSLYNGGAGLQYPFGGGAIFRDTNLALLGVGQ